MATIRIRDFHARCCRKDFPIPLELVSGEAGLEKTIPGPQVNRPGLGLAGFFEHFAFSRIQIFGKGETAFVSHLLDRKETENLEHFFSYDIACCVFSHNASIPHRFLEMAEAHGVAVFRTSLETSDFVRRIEHFLNEEFAPRVTMHGVLLEVFGVGVLMEGRSGIGKSECALELIERGHRLIADDVVEVKCLSGSLLIGRGSSKIAHHMEIRGLGIINISMLFGVGAIRDQKQIQLVVRLEDWDVEKEYERIGLDETTMDILGIQVPVVTIPITPVRNIPVIIETAAMNQRLKKLGFHAAREFDRKLREVMDKTSNDSYSYENYLGT